jgi:hypothetical protein
VVRGSYLDGCGEPLHVARTNIDQGRVSSETDVSIVVGIGDETSLPVRGGRLGGTLEPGFAGGSFRLCCWAAILDLGAARLTYSGLDVTLLEAVLAGGGVLGQPTLPGITPDLDVDGDGLERFVLDAENHIEQCIDGDGTVIAGRECWQDPAMADAVSLTLTLESTTARCLGPTPNWRVDAVGACDEPPETSTWQGTCSCHGAFSATTGDIGAALASATASGVPVVDRSEVAFRLVRIAELPAETLEWMGEPPDHDDLLAALDLDINAPGDEAPSLGLRDWTDATLLVRTGTTVAGATPGDLEWVRVDPSTTTADFDLVRMRSGGFDVDYGGPDDAEVDPGLRAPLEEAKRVILETLRACEGPTG